MRTPASSSLLEVVESEGTESHGGDGSGRDTGVVDQCVASLALGDLALSRDARNGTHLDTLESSAAAAGQSIVLMWVIRPDREATYSTPEVAYLRSPSSMPSVQPPHDSSSA